MIDEFLEIRRRQKVKEWGKQYKIAPEKKPVAKAYIATDRDIIVPYSTLVEATIRKPGSRMLMSKAEDEAATSQQIQEENEWSFDNGLAARPFDPSTMLVLHDNNPYFGSTVGQIAVDVAGLGYSLILRDGGNEDKDELRKAEEFLESPDGENTFHEVCKRWVVDWGWCGWAGFETRRDGRGLVSKVNHIPSKNLWVDKDGNKYAERARTKITWFNKYDRELDPDKRRDDISSETGTLEGLTSKNKANEVIFYKKYYPGNPHYGVPNIYPSVGSVMGMIGSLEFNLAFFNNFGIPAYFILLEGDWDEKAEKIVTDFLKECKNANNAHKTMVFTTPEGCKLTTIPVAAKVEEGSFSIFHKIWKEEILIAYRMPEYRLGIAVLGSLGGHLATEMTEIYKQSIVEPLQTILEHIFSNLIFKYGMKIMNYRIKFKDMETRDLDTEIERTTDLVRFGLLHRNDGRKRLELGEPYEGGDEYLIESNFIPVDQIGQNTPDETSKSKLRVPKLPKYVINLPVPQGEEISKGKQNTFESTENLKVIMGTPIALVSGGKLYGFLSLGNIQPLHKSQEESHNYRYSFRFSKLAEPLPVKVKEKPGSIISDNYSLISRS